MQQPHGDVTCASRVGVRAVLPLLVSGRLELLLLPPLFGGCLCRVHRVTSVIARPATGTSAGHHAGRGARCSVEIALFSLSAATWAAEARVTGAGGGALRQSDAASTSAGYSSA